MHVKCLASALAAAGFKSLVAVIFIIIIIVMVLATLATHWTLMLYNRLVVNVKFYDILIKKLKIIFQVTSLSFEFHLALS